jgi:RNA polymerase sigma-70 factor (ECF subfamily)
VDGPWDELGDWSRALEHDPRAFAAIFDHHERRVFRHAVQLADSYHDAEDVTAASFFELWRRREAVRLVADSTLPWLLVTATNISRNSRRALRRYRSLLGQMPRGENVGDPEVDRGLESRLHDSEELYRAMKSLNSNDASLLMLTAVEGLSVKEAAGLLGLTDGAGRVRLHRAKQRLRDQLHDRRELLSEIKGGGQ